MIVDHESDLKNLIIFCRYYKKHTKRQNGISSIPTSNWAKNLQADRFVPSESKSLIENNPFLKVCHFDFWTMKNGQKMATLKDFFNVNKGRPVREQLL